MGQQLRPEIAGVTRQIVVARLRPNGPCVVVPETQLKVEVPQARAAAKDVTLFDDIGGLEREIVSLRQIVELPLKSPALFAQLGIAALCQEAELQSPAKPRDHYRSVPHSGRTYSKPFANRPSTSRFKEN